VFYLLIFNYFCIMKKISLKGITKILSDVELKDVKGGAQDPVGGLDRFMIQPDNEVEISVCPAGQKWDWYYMTCMPISQDQGKIEACVGLNEGDPCAWTLPNGNMSFGRCLTLPLSPRHCSNLR
jgi:hypothetical protein